MVTTAITVPCEVHVLRRALEDPTVVRLIADIATRLAELEMEGQTARDEALAMLEEAAGGLDDAAAAMSASLSPQSRAFVDSLRERAHAPLDAVMPPAPRTSPRAHQGPGPRWVVASPIRRGVQTPLEDRMTVLEYGRRYGYQAALENFGISQPTYYAWKREMDAGDWAHLTWLSVDCARCGQPLVAVIQPGDTDRFKEARTRVLTECHDRVAHIEER